MADKSTSLEELISAERRKAAARIAKLRRQVEAEQRRIDLRVVALMAEKQPELYDLLAHEARAALESEHAERSRRAKRVATDMAPSESLDLCGVGAHHE